MDALDQLNACAVGVHQFCTWLCPTRDLSQMDVPLQAHDMDMLQTPVWRYNRHLPNVCLAF